MTDSQPKHRLKIADTPTDDEDVVLAVSEDTIAPSPPAPQSESKSSQQSLWTDDSQGKKRSGKTQRLSPEEMDEELDRVSRLNGVPTLARGTSRDE
jgi:hypothetical protein